MRIVALDTATRATATAALADLPRAPSRPTVRPLSAVTSPRRAARPGPHPRTAWSSWPGGAGADRRAAGAGIERIAVGVGPGTFTGLRIGVASAQALAHSRAIPLVGVSSLHTLGLGAAEWRSAAVLALIDARRGEVFAAGWPAIGQL